MCGVAGWIGTLTDTAVLVSMTDALAHRGPDGEGVAILPLEGPTVAALGHRRLSIIDLAGGHQPMRSHDGRFTVVFNGEIYNYRELRIELASAGAQFVTNSDTEVIVESWRRWGEGCLQRFRGMFAFVLHDSMDRSVVMARDPFGKKPLFIWQQPGQSGDRLVFASEIPALLRHPDVAATLDPDSVYEYLVTRYVPGPHTFFESIRKLMPGSVLTWRDGEASEHRYWQAPEERAAGHAGPVDPVESFCEVFDESVRLRLRADVPIGAFLSGGLDSTAVVATLAHLGVRDIRTFSVGFAGDQASELPAAERTATALGTIHHPLILDSDDLTKHLPMLSRRRGAPMAEAADLPIYLMSVEAAKDVKVILSGEGSDELFGGYPKHVVEAHFGRLANAGAVRPAARTVLAMSSRMPGRWRRLTIAARAMSERSFDERMDRWFGAITPKERDVVWNGPVPTHQRSEVPYHCAPGASSLRRVLHYDQTSWLPDNLLERLDMMTMAASLEARAPFMDVRLADFAASLPDTWRISGRTTKRVVREALGTRLPQEVINRPKIGFRMPVAEWFRGPLEEPFRDLVLGRDAVTAPLLDRMAIARLFEEHSSGARDHDKTLWSLFALETFLREFF
jgi:asparagine synthase (glutamine-hydrolysing)